ncbi:hypothetical protein J6590_047659 [Homalodisca vitripennis]|nr:hypothetical protein J6590_047659 [Homalodisca vitripennis]
MIGKRMRCRGVGAIMEPLGAKLTATLRDVAEQKQAELLLADVLTFSYIDEHHYHFQSVSGLSKPLYVTVTVDRQLRLMANITSASCSVQGLPHPVIRLMITHKVRGAFRFHTVKAERKERGISSEADVFLGVIHCNAFTAAPTVLSPTAVASGPNYNNCNVSISHRQVQRRINQRIASTTAILTHTSSYGASKLHVTE